MRKPEVDVVVIGAMKCGTTALYHFFRKNKVFGVNKSKEVNFFLKESDAESLAAYDRTFLPGMIRIDVSPNYSKRHLYETNIPYQIHQVNPDAKIIFVVRDPLRRIESHIYHNILRDRVIRKRLGDLDYLENYILTSSYLYQINPFLAHFEKQNILVVQQEMMRQDPDQVIQKVFSFLGIEESPDHKLSELHASSKGYLIPFHDTMRKIMGLRFMSRLYNPFWHVVGIKPEPVTIDRKTRELIRTKTIDDIEEFCRLFPIDKSLWNYYFEPDGKVIG
jgi:hypothetical protein